MLSFVVKKLQLFRLSKQPTDYYKLKGLHNIWDTCYLLNIRFVYKKWALSILIKLKKPESVIKVVICRNLLKYSIWKTKPLTTKGH